MRKTLLVVLSIVLSAAPVRAAWLRADLALNSVWLAAEEDVVATVTIENRSPRTVLLPRWLVPGPRLDASLFAVTRDGQPVTYLGRLVKRAAPGPADFVALAPGESLSAVTELTRHYDMSGGGEYVVAYRIDLLEGIGAEGNHSFAPGAGGLRETVESNAVAVWREGPSSLPLPAWSAAPAGESSLSTQSCSTSQSTTVTTAVGNATNYATGARSYLDDRTWSTVGSRYTTWFGAANSGRFDTVSNHFIAIRSAFQTAPIVVDCSCDDPYYAYVHPSQPYTIYVCNAFWTAPATGTDSKAGTLVHEMSHFNVVAATDDHVYGQTSCRGLATSQPNLAVQNADSHEYFAENTPPLEGGSAGSLRFAEATSSVDESDGSVTLTVRRVGGSTGPASVHYATSDGTAGAPDDYASRTGLLAWDSGVGGDLSFTVPVLDDTATEASENFTVVLSSPTGGATLGSPSTSTVRILDNDDNCTPSLCVSDANTLCLAGGSGTPNRFRVRVTWTDFSGGSGPGVALAYTADSGFFYFFNPQILELLVKIVNGCSANGSYWFFYASTSNVALAYTVEDLQACKAETVTVPLGQFASNGDIEFFDQSCP